MDKCEAGFFCKYFEEIIQKESKFSSHCQCCCIQKLVKECIDETKHQRNYSADLKNGSRRKGENQTRNSCCQMICSKLRDLYTHAGSRCSVESSEEKHTKSKLNSTRKRENLQSSEDVELRETKEARDNVPLDTCDCKGSKQHRNVEYRFKNRDVCFCQSSKGSRGIELHPIESDDTEKQDRGYETESDEYQSNEVSMESSVKSAETEDFKHKEIVQRSLHKKRTKLEDSSEDFDYHSKSSVETDIHTYKSSFELCVRPKCFNLPSVGKTKNIIIRNGNNFAVCFKLGTQTPKSCLRFDPARGRISPNDQIVISVNCEQTRRPMKYHEEFIVLSSICTLQSSGNECVKDRSQTDAKKEISSTDDQSDLSSQKNRVTMKYHVHAKVLWVHEAYSVEESETFSDESSESSDEEDTVTRSYKDILNLSMAILILLLLLLIIYISAVGVIIKNNRTSFYTIPCFYNLFN